MAALSPAPEDDQFNVYLSENGHLSFENPNYQLEHLAMACIDPDRLDDHLNCNIQGYDDLCHEATVANTGSGTGSGSNDATRRKYAAMGIESMGVDLHSGPITNLDNKKSLDDNCQRLLPEEGQISSPSDDMESEKLVAESSTEKQNKDDDQPQHQRILLSPDVVVKRRSKKKCSPSSSPQPDTDQQQLLPPGWEKHSDEQGHYFWHIKSGTIQRDAPVWEDEMQQQSRRSAVVRNVRSSNIFDEDFDPLLIMTSPEQQHKSAMSKSCTSSSIMDMSRELPGTANPKRRSLPPGKADFIDESQSGKPVKVKVTSLGWMELSEDLLTSENSSKAVNRCILQLSSLHDSMATSDSSGSGVWGGGKKLLMDLSQGTLRLVEPDSNQILNTQPIHTIRVWGVSRDNSRDFAYVARDKQSRKHLCHVFRCDGPARVIANALRDICKKILIERSLAQSSSRLVLDPATPTMASSDGKRKVEGNNKRCSISRPTNLALSFNDKLKTRTVPAPDSFPTPMEEPRKIIKARMLGSLQVGKACGMDVLNEAIDQMVNGVPREAWKMVSVAVAPSTITVSFVDGGDPAIDCRVRFLSFLGISRSNSQFCAFIVHTAQDAFVAHVFHCDPNAGHLCKTIEAACKLRYQKCLDARPQSCAAANGTHAAPAGSSGQPGNRASLGATLKSMLMSSLSSSRRPEGSSGKPS